MEGVRGEGWVGVGGSGSYVMLVPTSKSKKYHHGQKTRDQGGEEPASAKQINQIIMTMRGNGLNE